MNEAINFLAVLYKAGLSYSAICVARSALSSYLDCRDCDVFGEHRLVKRFIKGVFELRPALPKYSATWDVDIVLEYLETYYPLERLTLKELSYKLVMLLALLSGQRCQTLHCLSLASMKISDAKCVFSIDVLLKHSRKGKHLAPLEFVAFPQNSRLCVVSVLKEYLCRTKELRGSENMLLISYQKPYKHISKDTLARWIRDVLQRAGVDTQHFGAHSTRMASTTAAVSRGVPVDTLMRAAGWSSQSTFTRFYKKAPAVNMGQALLDSYIKKD